MEKQEKKERKILTENRMATINKREISYEGLVSQLENGEDGVYNLITDNGKNTIFQPKVTITKQDIEEIPLLRKYARKLKWAEKIDKLKVFNGERVVRLRDFVGRHNVKPGVIKYNGGKIAF